jgi:hypothetical protein
MLHKYKSIYRPIKSGEWKLRLIIQNKRFQQNSHVFGRLLNTKVRKFMYSLTIMGINSLLFSNLENLKLVEKWIWYKM